MIGGKDKIEDEKDDKKDGEDKKKSNADSGKIVNLMASDTTRFIPSLRSLLFGGWC